LESNVLEAGDKIVAVGNCSRYFNDGDKAVLLRQDPDGDWWADFSGNEEYYLGGIWSVGPVDIGFKLDKTGE
jgi:hypothetical protein